jgi:hypothetical protein
MKTNRAAPPKESNVHGPTGGAGPSREDYESILGTLCWLPVTALDQTHTWLERHLSSARRSLLVGRPAPRSRVATGTTGVGGGAGVRSR